MQLVSKNHKIQAYLPNPVVSGYTSYVSVYQDITSKGTTKYTITGNISQAGYYDIVPGPVNSNTIRNVISIDFSNESTSPVDVTVSFVDSSTSAYPIAIKTIPGSASWNAFLEPDKSSSASDIVISSSNYKVQSFLSDPVTANPVYFVAVYQDINSKGTTTYTVGGSVSGTTPVNTIPGPTKSNTTRKIVSLNFCNTDTSAAVVTVWYVTDQTQALGVRSLASQESWNVFSTVGTGTVTSIQLSAGTGITIGGTNPITASGTITVTNSAPDKVVSLTGGTGISTSGTYPNFTVTNTSPDQTVALTAGTGINITGTYPSFTVTNSSPSSGGTVTSVATSSPLTGGTITGSGTIGISQATTSANGYLSNTDWNTFNNKQGAITLTTTGTSGAATFVGNTLNIPQYSGGGGGADSINWTHTQALSSIGSTIKAEPLYATLASVGASGVNPTSQRIYLVAVWLPTAATITGVKWMQSTIGSYTASNFGGVGLYTLSSGTFTRVAVSANDTTLLQQGSANALKSKAFTSTYSASAGLYYAALLYSASATTTAPVLQIIPNAPYTSYTIDNTNGVYFSMFSNAQTSMPTSLTIPGFFLQSTIPYLALY